MRFTNRSAEKVIVNEELEKSSDYCRYVRFLVGTDDFSIY